MNATFFFYSSHGLSGIYDVDDGIHMKFFVRGKWAKESEDVENCQKSCAKNIRKVKKIPVQISK